VKASSSPIIFLCATILFLAAVIWLQRPLPETDLFAEIPERHFANFGPTTTGEIFAAKMAHARYNDRYDIGIFGNSRSLMLTAENIAAGDRTFFNFSIGGQSLRTSILLLEELAAIGKAPETALISFDNAELEYYQNPDTRGLWPRLAIAWRDIRKIYASEAPPLRQWLKMAWRHIYAAYKGGERYLDIEQFLVGINWRFNSATLQNAWHAELLINSNQGYRQDGSVHQKITERVSKFSLMPRQPPSILPWYLADDLRRLAALRQNGIRVIVYESLLEPRNAKYFATEPSAHATIVRKTFIRNCRLLNLECYPATNPTRYSKPSNWVDITHAPATFLGSYIRSLMNHTDAGITR